MWCEVDGTETYNTTQNGEETVPKFWVNIIKDNGSTDPRSEQPDSRWRTITNQAIVTLPALCPSPLHHQDSPGGVVVPAPVLVLVAR